MHPARVMMGRTSFSNEIDAGDTAWSEDQPDEVIKRSGRSFFIREFWR
jgi:hypothetical protein